MRRSILLGLLTSGSVLFGGGMYLFAAEGIPQIDPPAAVQDTQLNFQVESFDSQAMGTTRKYGVVLPPGYDPQGKIRYPVVVLLHGGHGTERDFEDKAKLTTVLHDLYAAKKLPPTIVITPDGNDQRGTTGLWDSEYFDGDNGKVSTLIGQELVKVVKQRYRTETGPNFWAIGGLSSGGWGALNIGLRHADNFHVFLSHTGYFIDRSGPENSPQKFIAQLPAEKLKSIAVYLDAGVNDHKYLKATKDFHQVLDQLGVANEYHEFPGGHGIVGPDVGWNYWHKHLADSLAFAGQHFVTARSAPSSSQALHFPNPLHLLHRVQQQQSHSVPEASVAPVAPTDPAPQQ
jgi:enterochelin esterase-like enzyme